MAIFTIIFLIVALILIGIGLAIGLVACALAAVLVGMGVVSSSFIIGIRTGKAAAGIKAFLLQCGILIGIPAGAVCAWLTKTLIDSANAGWPVLIYGALAGAVAGIVVALCLNFISLRLHAWVSTRFLQNTSRKPDAIEAGTTSSEPDQRTETPA